MSDDPHEHLTFPTDGVTLHAVAAGPPDGPLAILLHGFPEGWYGWRHQIPALANEGYRVVAPDLRGYGDSDKPREVGAYTLEALGRDVLGLIDALGRRTCHLVGHDWGAAIAWWTASNHPERLEDVAILNVPHPAVMGRALRSDPGQLARSAYMFFFALPWVPEAALRANGFRALERGMRTSAREDAFDSGDLRRYREAWSRPGALAGMLGPYRAAFRHPPSWDRPRVRVPTLVIWGAQDRFLKPELARASVDLCDDGRLVYLDDASHWLQHEEPETVNELLLGFFRGELP